MCHERKKVGNRRQRDTWRGCCTISSPWRFSSPAASDSASSPLKTLPATRASKDSGYGKILTANQEQQQQQQHFLFFFSIPEPRVPRRRASVPGRLPRAALHLRRALRQGCARVQVRHGGRARLGKHVQVHVPRGRRRSGVEDKGEKTHFPLF